MVATHHAAAPVPVPLPPVASDAAFTEAQWGVLFALIDAVVPPIVPEGSVTDAHNQLRISRARYEDAYTTARLAMADPPDLERFKAYLRTRQIDSPRFVQNVRRTFESVPEESRRRLGVILYLLKSAFRPCSIEDSQGRHASWLVPC